MNNYEKIKQMDIEEMAKNLYGLSCPSCVAYKNCNGTSSVEECYVKIKQWLESEVDKNGN